MVTRLRRNVIVGMNKKWKLGTWFGIDVFLHWSMVFIVIWAFVAFGGLLGVLQIAAVFACVVAHEYGHVLMARRYGIGTRDITLYPIGGVAALRAMPKRPSEEIAVSLAGPAVNVGIALVLGLFLFVFGGFAGPIASVGGFLSVVLITNLFLAVFNLIPAFPMDGGRVLRAWLARKQDRLQATEKAVKVGRVFAVIFALAALVYVMPTLLLIACFVYLAGTAELQQAYMERRNRPWEWVVNRIYDRRATTSARMNRGEVIEVEVIPPPTRP